VGKQIIKQHNGKLALWCSNSDRLVLVDASREEVLAYFHQLYLDELARNMAEVDQDIENVLSGKAKQSYYQFAKPWREALIEDLFTARQEQGEFNDLEDEDIDKLMEKNGKKADKAGAEGGPPKGEEKGWFQKLKVANWNKRKKQILQEHISEYEMQKAVWNSEKSCLEFFDLITEKE